ncbi:MAG: 2-hydroxyacyl-CoA dehydratase [Deltaproteobacteria bacterium]|nr:2-hydroxyacyl-CoA dehydratase [Deltaproteobacteria bacterium]
MSDHIGLTSTIPVEIIYAAGLKPVDLNNLFISEKNPEKLLRQAEAAGFAHNVCSWIKGIYSTVINYGISSVIAVTGGDCSNTIALGEVLSREGVSVIPFDYPLNKEGDILKNQMEKLMKTFSTTWENVYSAKKRLDRIRSKLKELDRLTFKENLVSGFENHLFLVTSSDFKSAPDLFEKDLDQFLAGARTREPSIESLGARVVFNETQRQFSMPYEVDDLVEQYLKYTYPYRVEGRIEDINTAIKERRLDGLIHYTQTFCYRQIYDIILKQAINIPILTIEGDRPGPLDARTIVRIETFVEILKDRKYA